MDRCQIQRNLTGGTRLSYYDKNILYWRIILWPSIKRLNESVKLKEDGIEEKKEKKWLPRQPVLRLPPLLHPPKQSPKI
jgi:hypothetical protein